MTQFKSYRRIDNFVIEFELNPTSHNLEVTSTLYYPVSTKHVASQYTLSIENRSARISLISQASKYTIKGTLSLHFKSLEQSTEVIIFGDLSFGRGENLNYFEGVLCRFDTISGNLIVDDSEFPNIEDLSLTEDEAPLIQFLSEENSLEDNSGIIGDGFIENPERKKKNVDIGDNNLVKEDSSLSEKREKKMKAMKKKMKAMKKKIKVMKAITKMMLKNM